MDFPKVCQTGVNGVANGPAKASRCRCPPLAAHRAAGVCGLARRRRGWLGSLFGHRVCVRLGILSWASIFHMGQGDFTAFGQQLGQALRGVEGGSGQFWIASKVVCLWAFGEAKAQSRGHAHQKQIISGSTTRPRLARKQNIASEVGPTLQDAFFFPTLREASARQHQARYSAQTGRCKLVCASCSTQVALCKLLCASCSAQVAPASWSLQVALCKLRSLQVALCKLLCASCSVQVALRKLLCASCSRQGALRKLVGASWSAQVALCNLLCASCSAQVAVKCKLHLATPARGPGRNRTLDPPVPGAGARTTRQLPRTSSNNKRRKKP